MANTKESSFSTSNGQHQDPYLQIHAINQHRQEKLTIGAAGFQPNAWGCPQHQDASRGEDSANQSREERCQVTYYNETARSFTAAAAVAAVAAAAYISSSNAVANSEYSSNTNSGYGSSTKVTRYGAVNGLQKDNSVYKAEPPKPYAEPCGCTMRSMGQQNTSNAVSSALEAHSIPIHFPSGATDILPACTSNSCSKVSTFMNTSKGHNYEENYSSKSQSYVVVSTNADPAISSRKRNDKPLTHVKKPLNAFMLFMKAMRAKVVAECTMKESAAINQILGRKWHALPHEEQAKFYELARKEKELHQRMYPGWSARDNYAYHAKRRKKRCPYRVYNGLETVGDQQKQTNEGSPPPREKQVIDLPASGSITLGNVFKNSAFYASPFGIEQTAYSGRDVEPKCSNANGEHLSYFGLVDRYQQVDYKDQQLPQSKQSFLLNIQQAELNCSTKEDCKPRLPSSFYECIDSISAVQHFNPSTSWFLHNQPPRLTYDSVAAGVVSPWSQTHPQVEDRFQRRLSKSNCLGHSNPYTVPSPYYSNGNLDYRYTERIPNSYISTQKTSPKPLEINPALKLQPSYDSAPSKVDSFHPGYKEAGCEYTSASAPIYGFSSS